MLKRYFITTLLILCFISSVCAADYFAIGKNYFNNHEYQQARVNFVQALRNNPNDATCRYYYAQTLTYLKSYEQAKKEYGYVIQLAPNTTAAKYSQIAINQLNELTASPSAATTSTSTQQVNSNDNYVKQATTTSGDLVTWDLNSMPLKVYMDNSLGVSTTYVTSAQSALAEWKAASNGLFDYTYTNEKQNADVVIQFRGIAQKSENQILGLTQHNSKDGYIKKVTVTLYTQGPNYKPLTSVDLYNVALHEFGHLIGIWGHSNNPNDVMYSLYDINGQKSKILLSQRDKNTAKAIYEIDKNPYATGQNAISKVLGNKEQRVNDKIQQNLDYIKQVPANPIGYVNAGNTYMANNNEFEAINCYKQALKLDSRNKDAIKALATIYFKRNDINNAEAYYRLLISVDPQNPHSYCNLMNMYINNGMTAKANSTLSNLLYRNPNAKNEECIKSIMTRLGR